MCVEISLILFCKNCVLVFAHERQFHLEPNFQISTLFCFVTRRPLFSKSVCRRCLEISFSSRFRICVATRFVSI